MKVCNFPVALFPNPILFHMQECPVKFSVTGPFNFKRSSSFGERLRCVFRMTFLGQVPHQEYSSITYLFRVHTLSALYSSAGGNVGSHVPFETFFGKPGKSYHPPFHRRLEKFQLCKH